MPGPPTTMVLPWRRPCASMLLSSPLRNASRFIPVPRGMTWPGAGAVLDEYAQGQKKAADCILSAGRHEPPGAYAPCCPRKTAWPGDRRCKRRMLSAERTGGSNQSGRQRLLDRVKRSDGTWGAVTLTASRLQPVRQCGSLGARPDSCRFRLRACPVSHGHNGGAGWTGWREALRQ